MDIMRVIRRRAKAEEIDYLFLMDCLSDYKRPRDKLTSLLKRGDIIRVKKGLYVFGKEYRQRFYSLEVLSNLIYGPSYISFESALSYYNLIPERVTRVTAASYKKTKRFSTPVSDFDYYFLPPSKFTVGITWEPIDGDIHFFIATKEKALVDYVARLKPFYDKEALLTYLTEGVRIDFADFAKLKKRHLNEIANFYQNRNVTLLCQCLKK